MSVGPIEWLDLPDVPIVVDGDDIGLWSPDHGEHQFVQYGEQPWNILCRLCRMPWRQPYADLLSDRRAWEEWGK